MFGRSGFVELNVAFTGVLFVNWKCWPASTSKNWANVKVCACAIGATKAMPTTKSARKTIRKRR